MRQRAWWFSIATLAAALVGCDERVVFSEREIREAPLGAGLPPGFLLGAATASHQIEGGNDNDWTEWERGSFADGRPHIAAGELSGRAAGSWELWREDVAALRRLGANAYRLSIEWSRLEPREGAWDDAAAARYREMLTALRAAGITPMVTVYHFTLPRWFAAHGGWEWPGALDAFERFTERAARAFGDLVDHWVTINEPTVFVSQGYQLGVWPPGVADLARATRVLATLLRAHARAAALRRVDVTDADRDGRATRVGLAHSMRIFQAGTTTPLDREAAALLDDYANEAVPRAAATGRIRLFVPGVVSIDEAVDGLAGSFDYVGVNYYTRVHVRASFSATPVETFVPVGRPTNDLAWEIYPEGLYRLLVRLRAFGWPIVVTENGIADADDAQRGDYLRAHLFAIQRAVAAGADVRGYYHWTLMDNFEWAEGRGARFGLFAVDFTQPHLPRTMRPSAEVFRGAARGLGLTPLEP